MKLKRRSFLIALSGVSCAVAVIFLTLGNWFSFLTLACYLFAEAALLLPVAAGSRRAGLMAYLAAVLLGFLFGGIWNPWRMFLFCIFFGLHPLANSLQDKWKLNKWLAFLIKAVWFDVALWLTWQFAYEVFFDAGVNWVERIGDWIFLIIGAGGTLFFFFYDWAVRRMQRVMAAYVQRLGGGGAKKRAPERERQLEDVFGAPEQGQGVPPQDAANAAGAPPAGKEENSKGQCAPPQGEESTDGKTGGEARENEKSEDVREDGEDR